MSKLVSGTGSCSLASLQAKVKAAAQGQKTPCEQVRRAARLLLDAQQTTDSKVAQGLLEQAEVELHWANQWS